MMGHDICSLLNSDTFTFRMKCSNSDIIVLHNILSLSTHDFDHTHLCQANRCILSNYVADVGSLYSHFCLEFFRFGTLSGDLSVDFFFLCNKFICILFRLLPI